MQRLQLVGSGTPPAREDSPAQQVFDHWVWMLGKNPRRTVFGPTRQKTVARALELYDVETLQLAIEGCASHPFNNGDNERGEEYTDLGLILRDEEHVERFARRGEKLRASAARALQREAAAGSGVDAVPATALDQAAALAQRERVRQLAAQLSGRRRG